MNLALGSQRARRRLQALLGRPLPPERCVRAGRVQGPKAGCAQVTDAEWAQVQAKGWPSIRPCHACTRLDAPTQLPLPGPC